MILKWRMTICSSTSRPFYNLTWNLVFMNETTSFVCKMQWSPPPGQERVTTLYPYLAYTEMCRWTGKDGFPYVYGFSILTRVFTLALCNNVFSCFGHISKFCKLKLYKCIESIAGSSWSPGSLQVPAHEWVRSYQYAVRKGSKNATRCSSLVSILEQCTHLIPT